MKKITIKDFNIALKNKREFNAKKYFEKADNMQSLYDKSKDCYWLKCKDKELLRAKSCLKRSFSFTSKELLKMFR